MLTAFDDYFAEDSIMSSEIVDYIRTDISAASFLRGDTFSWGTILSWLFTKNLDMGLLNLSNTNGNNRNWSRSWIDEWMLGKIIAATFQDLGINKDTSWQGVFKVKFLISLNKYCGKFQIEKKNIFEFIQDLLKDEDVQSFIRVNRYRESLWFNDEAFEELLWWIFFLLTVRYHSEIIIENKKDIIDIIGDPKLNAERIFRYYWIVDKIRFAKNKSGYKVVNLLDEIRKSGNLR